MGAPLLLDMTRCVARRLKGQTPSGIDRVADAYAARFAESARAVLQIRGRMIVLNEEASRNLFAALELPAQRFRIRLAALIVRLPWSTAKPGELCGAHYFNVSHTDFDLALHWQEIARHKLKPVYFLHDLIPVTHPHLTTPHKTERHRGRVLGALKQGAGIVVNSQATAEELRKFATDHALDIPPMLVAPIAGAKLPRRVECDLRRDTYFVSVGTIETRKNHALLLDVWAQLVDRLGGKTPRLILAGNWGLGAGSIRKAMKSDPRLRQLIEVRSGMEDAEIARLVAGARAVLLPTLAEGYGLPMIEALQLRVPVITSDLPSLREIGQTIPTFIDPTDINAWAAVIAEFHVGGGEWRRQMAAIDAFRAPNWAEHFAALDGWLARLDHYGGGTATCVGSDYHLYNAPTEQKRRS
ncbi:glycosyltransferase [Pontixanthobacter aquaemixtae]|uniref:Glycosyltransferase n=1 Tax=Pontixanthobacter aquaemixtae TaxID=1958940 RepID=A0A844ZUA5_9SPHN|nr:glycosyltransferase [Pontixanthobacter aquaemixtae]MXO90862.1 glycosyltransferase [Pontixanthobacter aquaemixtae]